MRHEPDRGNLQTQSSSHRCWQSASRPVEQVFISQQNSDKMFGVHAAKGV